MSEWKPGDVAMVDGPGERLPITFYTNDDTTELMFNNGHGYQYAARHLAQSARPLVVIDPEDREQVERLATALRYGIECVLRVSVDDHDLDHIGNKLQGALRSLLAPPRPEEPTNRYAVVLDADGTEWLRSRDGLWCYSHTENLRTSWITRSWSSIAVVRVLSEGVQP